MTRIDVYRAAFIACVELALFVAVAFLVRLLTYPESKALFCGLYLVLFAKRLYGYLFREE